MDDTIPEFYVIMNIEIKFTLHNKRKEASMAIKLELSRIEAIALKVALKNQIIETASFLKRFKSDSNKTYYKNSLYLMKQKSSALRKIKNELI